jgi:hypothetical protein
VALDAINQNTGDLLFRSRLMTDARTWGDNDPSAKPTADQLIDELRHYHQGDQITLKP